MTPPWTRPIVLPALQALREQLKEHVDRYSLTARASLSRFALPSTCLLMLGSLFLQSYPVTAASGPTEGWKPLFNGRTLEGWTPKITGYALGEDPLKTFTVRDGAIKVSYDQYDRFAGQFGHLAYRLPYSAFRIRLEYRFYGQGLADIKGWQQSNSGIMLLGQPPETMRKDQQFPVSLEVQLLGAERAEPGPTGNLCTPGTNVVLEGEIITQHCLNSSSPVMPNSQWVQIEVEVDRHGNISHFVEGKPVLRYSAPQYDPTDPDAKLLIARAGGRLAIARGYIYLQSEGHPVEFRNIELIRLDDSPTLKSEGAER